jgi:hypothetical protein
MKVKRNKEKKKNKIKQKRKWPARVGGQVPGIAGLTLLPAHHLFGSPGV